MIEKRLEVLLAMLIARVVRRWTAWGMKWARGAVDFFPTHLVLKIVQCSHFTPPLSSPHALGQRRAVEGRGACLLPKKLGGKGGER